jgi:hypothetical protein
MTLGQIEEQVNYSEKCPYRSVNRANEWKQELISSSRRVFGSKYDPETPPASACGKWKRI